MAWVNGRGSNEWPRSGRMSFRFFTATIGRKSFSGFVAGSRILSTVDTAMGTFRIFGIFMNFVILTTAAARAVLCFGLSLNGVFGLVGVLVDGLRLIDVLFRCLR